jgi:predicted transcriptional regulator
LTDRQCTLGELDGIRTVKGLSENQRKIISLVNCGLTQSQVADKLGFSRAYINQQIKRLISFNLIQRIETHPSVEGKRDYTHFYELSPELKGRIASNKPEEVFTAMRTHNIRRKFKIISQSAPPTKDKRTSYSKSWMMRGGERHKFWFPGKAGYPSVTVDVHPKTLVFYMDRGQNIVAHTKEEARNIAWLAIYKAKDQFVLEQSKFGITFETEIGGEEISKPHVGLVFRENGPLDSETHIPGTWVDASPEKELGPGFKEFEMHIDHPLATPLEKGVMAVARVGDTIKESIQLAMPEAMKEFEKSFAPLTSEIHTVMAHIQSGQSVQNQINQLIVLVAQLVKDNHDLKERLDNQNRNL